MGEVFAGRYELVDPIGRGGVGAVWRVWDHRRRRYVAAKVLQQRDAHTLLRFVREQALRIDHPYVLAPASWAADDDKVLFTMDLVGGGSFAHLIGDYGPLPPRYVCTLLDQLLSGLAAVHAEGVVHRDIKPANILLEATGTGRPHVRLSDFGIALTKGEPRLTEANYVMGTPGYFAPEQMMGDEPDFPADLFAVGLVALYLLSGHKPDADALIKLFEQGVPNAPTGVPEPLWQVIANLLQPDPEDRFRTATGARKALLAATEMLPEPGIDDEVIEVFDHLGPLPEGFGSEGPFRTIQRPGADTEGDADTSTGTGTGTGTAHAHSGPTPQPPGPQGPSTPTPSEPSLPQPSESSVSQPSVSQPSMSDTGSFQLPPPQPQTPHTGIPQHPAPQRPPAPQPPTGQPPTGQNPSGQHPSGQHLSGQFPSGQPQTPYPPHAPHTPYSGLPQPPASQPAPAQPTTPPRPVRPAQPPQATPDPRQQPGPPPAHTPTPTPTPATASAPAAQREFPPTRPYTAPQPQVPPTARRRPGPSRKTTIAILIAAAVCFAVGTWALLTAG